MKCGICKIREGNKIKAGCKTFFFCEKCLGESAKKLEDMKPQDISLEPRELSNPSEVNWECCYCNKIKKEQ